MIDTRIKSPTAPLVEHFRELRNNKSYLEKFNNEYVPLISKCMSNLIDKDDMDFFNNLLSLSLLQTELLSHTIPADFRKYFLTDINKEGFQVKLCGAGGGGYLLGFAKDIEKTNEFWNNFGCKIAWIK